MKRFLFAITECIWGFPQTFMGLLIFILTKNKDCRIFHGAVVCIWRHPYSVSLGLFIFISEKSRSCRPLLVHEYGHCIQSAILGAMYLPLVLLPSMLWLRLPLFRRFRRKRGVSYYSFITERTADALGERACGERAMGERGR